MKKLVTLFVVLLYTVCIFAYDCKIDGIYYNLDKTNMSATVTYQNGKFWNEKSSYSGIITIPLSITYQKQAFAVKAISYTAFEGCTSLTSITIPNSVTTIGDAAFSGCSGLTSIIIPNSITSIGDNVFSGCTGLTSIIIPNSITSIGDNVFSGCTGLTSITIPNSVTSIGDNAFNGCSGLTSITIPNSVTSIGNGAFGGCLGLTTPIFNANCFAYMPTSYCGAYTIPDGIKHIADCAFDLCKNLTSVVIPNSVTTIGSRAFRGCEVLTSITVPNSVKKIGRGAFYDCSSLISVFVLNPNVNIGTNAFFYCTITDLYCGASVDLSQVAGTIKNVHRLSEEDLQYSLPFNQYIQNYVETRVNRWQKKGDYEKTSDWQKRVNETTRKQKVNEYVKEAEKKYLDGYAKLQNYKFTLGKYDPDNEVFLVKEDKLGDLLVSVPIANAKYVGENWSSSTSTPHYILAGTEVVLQSIDFTFPNNKKYTYKPNQQLTYSTPNLDYNFDPIELPELQTVTMGGAAQVPQAQPQAAQYVSSITVTKPFDLTPMSSVLVSYQTHFSKYEMPDLDVSFPYVVIRVKLTGAPNMVRLAKQTLMLNLGQSYQTEQTVTTYDNMVLYLIPVETRNIYLTCGDGCERQLIYSGRLQPNTIYDGTVEVK